MSGSPLSCARSVPTIIITAQRIACFAMNPMFVETEYPFLILEARLTTAATTVKKQHITEIIIVTRKVIFSLCSMRAS